MENKIQENLNISYYENGNQISNKKFPCAACFYLKIAGIISFGFFSHCMILRINKEKSLISNLSFPKTKNILLKEAFYNILLFSIGCASYLIAFKKLNINPSKVNKY